MAASHAPCVFLTLNQAPAVGTGARNVSNNLILFMQEKIGKQLALARELNLLKGSVG